MPYDNLYDCIDIESIDRSKEQNDPYDDDIDDYNTADFEEDDEEMVFEE